QMAQSGGIKLILEPDSVSEATRCKLSGFAYIHQDGGDFVLESPLSVHKLVFLDKKPVDMVYELVKGGSIVELAERIPDWEASTVRGLVEVLASCRFVSTQNDHVSPDEDEPPLAIWEFHDLLFQARSRAGRHRKPSGGTYRFQDEIPPLPLVKPPASEEMIPLEEPDLDTLEQEDVPFSAVLEDRMSVREFSEDPITAEELGHLLFRTARIKYVQKDDKTGDVGFRPSPGGGAIHELEIYPLVQRCEGLAPGLYHYRQQEHQLERLSGMAPELQSMVHYAAGAMGKLEDRDRLQVLLLITSRFPRLAWKYQSMAYSVTLKNVGCLYQTFYLVATAMNLAPSAIGSGDSELFAKATGIDYYSEPLIGEFVIGRPRE
ncbi:SagB family peptide dehydrogenase, partial [Thermodesulfobacteriota bacterium]